MAQGRSAFRYRVDLPARVHSARDENGEGFVARAMNLGRSGVGLRIDWPIASADDLAETSMTLEAGDAVRVTVHDEWQGHPLIRQWSGRVAHARTGRGGGRLGIGFEWPEGRPGRELAPDPLSSRSIASEPGQAGSASGWIAALALTGFAIDQASKTWAASVPLGMDWRHILAIVPVENFGALGGLGSGTSLSGLACASACLALVGLVLRRERAGQGDRRLVETVGLGLLAAGMIGNSADRLALGHVRDFLVAGCLPHWAFNLADVFILTGASAWLLDRAVRFTEDDRWNP
jgi:lipoprotein signal peptidase